MAIPVSDTPINSSPLSSSASSLQPAGSAVVPGSAGTIAGTAELVPAMPAKPQPSLPGLEGFIPPQAAPLELDYRTRSLTKASRAKRAETEKPLNGAAQALLETWQKEGSSNRGACLKIFPNGEITGGYYRTGHRNISKKAGRTISQTFTKQARKTIRRAVECSPTEFKLFITLTFDPKQSQLTDSGQVDQEWAKKEFKRFLNTVKKKYDRRLEKTGNDLQELNYIWVAEIQELHTKNIHFHILIDQPFIPVKWLVTVWGQAANSVNVKKLSNQEHAVRYMLKYMGKGHCPIEGKRYGMTQNLMARMKPIEVRYEGEEKREAFRTVKRKFYWNIQNHGGHVSDFGLSIPAPRRQKTWRDKEGIRRISDGVPKWLAESFLQALKKPMEQIDRENEILGVSPADDSDVPF